MGSLWNKKRNRILNVKDSTSMVKDMVFLFMKISPLAIQSNKNNGTMANWFIINDIQSIHHSSYITHHISITNTLFNYSFTINHHPHSTPPSASSTSSKYSYPSLSPAVSLTPIKVIPLSYPSPASLPLFF